MRLISIAPVLLLASLILAGSSAAAPRRMLFRGRVQAVGPGKKIPWFTMNGGGSKKYSSVRIIVDPKTGWKGRAARSRRVSAGEPVEVDCSALPDGSFRALSVLGADPKAGPSAAVMGRP